MINRENIYPLNEILQQNESSLLEATEQPMPSTILGQRHNLLLDAASPLIALYLKIKNAVPQCEISQFQKDIVNEFIHFKNQLIKFGYPVYLSTAASYCLATAIDESVLNTPWGSSSTWSQQSLLNTLHNDTFGGEKFYLILEKLSQDVPKNFHLLELHYLLLNLGYRGKYYNSEESIIDETLSNLYFLISQHRSKFAGELPHDQNDVAILSNKPPFPAWLIIGLTALILLFSTLVFDYRSEQMSRKIDYVLQDTKSHIYGDGTKE